MKRQNGAPQTDPRKDLGPEGFPSGGDTDGESEPGQVHEGEVFDPDAVRNALGQICALAFESGKQADIDDHQGAKRSWESVGMHSGAAQVLFRSRLDMNQVIEVWSGAYLLGWESVSSGHAGR